MAENPVVETPVQRPAWQTAVGVVLLVLVVAGLLAIGVRRMNNLEWAVLDTVAAAISGVGVLLASVFWAPELRRAFGSRSALLQLNAGLTTFLVLGILVLLNYVVFPRHLGRWKLDLTHEKFYSLAPQTVNLVKGLKKNEAIEIIGIVPRDQYGNRNDLRVMEQRLQEYDRLSPYLDVRVRDPLTSKEGMELLQQGALTSTLGAVVRFKDKPEQREAANSTEEADITQAIQRLLTPSSRKVYFLTGHGEPALSNTEQPGLSTFQQLLQRERFETAELNLISSTAVPSDAAALVVVGPRQPLAPDELQRLDTWLAQGGRLLAFLDVESRSNLPQLLAKYGVQFHRAAVADPPNAFANQAIAFFSADYGDHPAVALYKKAAGQAVSMFLQPGYVTPSGQGDLETSNLIQTSASAYGEAHTPQGGAPEGEPKEERTTGPLTLAIAASSKEPVVDDKDKAADKPAEETSRVRLAVFADGEYVANMWSQFPAYNYQVAADTLHWLTDNTRALGIRPKDPTQAMKARELNLDKKTGKWLVWLTLVMPVLLVIVAGAYVAWRRR